MSLIIIYAYLNSLWVKCVGGVTGINSFDGIYGSSILQYNNFYGLEKHNFKWGLHFSPIMQSAVFKYIWFWIYAILMYSINIDWLNLIIFILSVGGLSAEIFMQSGRKKLANELVEDTESIKDIALCFLKAYKLLIFYSAYLLVLVCLIYYIRL